MREREGEREVEDAVGGQRDAERASAEREHEPGAHDVAERAARRSADAMPIDTGSP
jgi:hypothetical protein